MKIQHSIQTWIFALLFSGVLAGCEKFLDAEQPLQVSQDEVFSTEKGFTEALNGVYLQLGTRALYGRDLSFGFLSILARSYDTTIAPQAGNLFYEGARYNYADPAVQLAIKTIWDSTYQGIAGINNLLEQMEARKSVFTGNNFNLLKGEALALRAYLHFDLLRMYGPAEVRNNLSVVAIPYVTKLSPYGVEKSTTAQVLDACFADLKEAETLITEPAKLTGHIRFWGIKALKARIYLYKGDIDNARTCAQQVIDGKAFQLATNNSDPSFSQEHIFNLLVYNNQLGFYERGFFNTSTPMGLLPANQNLLYLSGSGNTNDWRKAGAFLDPATGNTTNPSNPNAVVMPKKFNTTTINTLPMIRLTEMYYIAAECAREQNDLTTATALLDSVRAHRNIPVYTMAALPADSITAEIAREYQKEMLGEGQVFFYYKRKNLPFSTLPFTKVPVVANASYVFPKPE